ncbi:hypothetical protein J6590_039847 [Homalodisca vitripennis]|nr:hypothetical protein J6590_039847 [Homalodisca vitripennis]
MIPPKSNMPTKSRQAVKRSHPPCWVASKAPPKTSLVARGILSRPQITCQIVQRDLTSEKSDDLGRDLRSREYCSKMHLAISAVLGASPYFWR